MSAMSTPSPPHHVSDRNRWVRVGAPLIAGAVVVGVGAGLGSANDWSTGALWGVIVLATVVAGAGFAIPAAMHAPSLREAPRVMDSAVASTIADPSLVTIGARVNEDPGIDGLSPERVLVLSGASRSGKSTIAAQLITNRPGWSRASCGRYVRARARELGIEDTLVATHALGQRLVDEMGGPGFLQAVLDHAEVPIRAENLIIDDVYHIAVFEALRARWPGVRFTSVELPESVRRGLMHEQGLDEVQVDSIEDSPLDRAVVELELHYQPEARLRGAAHPEDADTAIEQIDELFAAA